MPEYGPILGTPLSLGRGSRPTEFTELQKNFILGSYPETDTGTIASKLSVTNDIIIGFLKRENIYLGFGRRSGLSVDKRLFQWSPNFAYFLGYVYADGCVFRTIKRENGRKDRLIKNTTIDSEDKQILDDIKQAMKIKAKVFSYARYNNIYHRLKVTSSWVYDRLVDFGISERKSYEGMRIPKVPDDYIRHFARGFIDGDGSVGRRSYFSIKISASDGDFIKWLRDAICSHVRLEHTPTVCKDKNIKFYTATFYCRNGKRLYNWLYPEEGQLRLERKWFTPKFIDSEL